MEDYIFKIKDGINDSKIIYVNGLKTISWFPYAEYEFDMKKRAVGYYQGYMTAKQDSKDEADIDYPAVDMVVTKYRWGCPACDCVNDEYNYVKEVECVCCGRKFEANLPIIK